MIIERVGIIGFGEVGRILAEDILKHSNVDLQVWDVQFSNANSVASKNLQHLSVNARLSVACEAANVARSCQILLSAVTADQAMDAACSILPGMLKNSFYVDLNSVSPGTKKNIAELIGAAGGRFVEASIMSPIMPLRIGAPILLCGPDTAEFERQAGLLGFSDIKVISDTLGVASATKMCRSVVIKGMEALVMESLLAARYYGVDESVVASLKNLFPGLVWSKHAHYLISRSLQHGTRRAAEMSEVAKTVQEAGLTPWMSEASIKRQAWAPQFETALSEDSLGNMLDVICNKISRNNY